MDEVIARARKGGLRYMPTAPFMHAARTGSRSTCAPRRQHRRDPGRHAAPRRGVDPRHCGAGEGQRDPDRRRCLARPLIDELKRRTYDLSSLRVIGSGGAVLDPSSKQELLELLPEGVKIIDTVGSSETGTQASHATARAASPPAEARAKAAGSARESGRAC
ncbi:MAG: hypothetical protein U1E86_28895 [Burkholderiaceae bacterium]